MLRDVEAHPLPTFEPGSPRMSRRRLRSSWLFLAVLCVLPLAARAANPAPTAPDCAAAGCVTPYWGAGQYAAGYGAGIGFYAGQTFTPKFTGVLSSLRLGLESYGPVGALVEIRTTLNGLPTTTVLGSATVAGAPYTPGVFYSANLAPQNIVLGAGTRYAIVFANDPPQIISILAAFPPCDAAASGANDFFYSYDNGQTWSFTASRDRSIIFEVCLDAATPASTTTWGRVKAFYR